MTVKLTKRKGFNFFRSYYDVFNELPEKDKLPFIEALLDRQFLGVKPTNLKGMAKFAWISQVNSIDSQVKGYEDKTGIKLTPPAHPPAPPPQGSLTPPARQVEEKGKVEEKEEYTYRKFKHLNLSVEEFERLREKFSKVDIDETLDKIENYKKNTNYTSLYLTALNWLKRDKGDSNKLTIQNTPIEK